MRIVPQNSYLLVKPVPKKEVLNSGIIIPVTTEIDIEAEISHCEIIEVSEGSKYKKGQIVLFSKLVPDNMQIELESGERVEYWFVREEDIKAIIEP